MVSKYHKLIDWYWRCLKVNICLVVELLFYTSRLDVNQEANINDAREGTSDAITMNNEVFDETHNNYIYRFTSYISLEQR